MPTNDIIDNRTHKLAEQIRTNLDSSTAAHFAVGYFFLSGFTAIADKLPHIKHLRLLIGNTTNRQTIEQIAQGYQQLELIRDRQEAQEFPNHQALITDNSKQVRSQLELMDQSDESETLVKNLVQTIEEKRLEVKVYTKGVLHAKAYIFDYGEIFDGKGKKLDRSEQGVAIVGSSNLTLSGLNNNTELNVVIHGNDNHQQLTNWFDELWDVAEDFDAVLMQEMKQSWVMNIATPYDVYMKTLCHLVRDRLEATPVEIFVDPNDISKQLAEFQTRAVQNAVQNIQNYGGAFVSDVVGLGKSFIGAAIIKWMEQHERARTLIICPAPLIEMWERYNEKYHLNARVLSMGMLKSDSESGLRTLLEDEKYKNRDFLLVDESHHLRNYGTQRYKVLQEYLAAGDRRCCFLTATPRNKSAWDIYHQIKLFHQTDITNLPIDPPDLKKYFQLIEKGERNLPDLLSHILIRRTRNHILRFYGLDSKTNLPIVTNFQEYLSGQRKAYIMVGGKQQFFPRRQLETIEYSIEDTYNGLYQQLRQHLGKANSKKSVKTLSDSLCYARYGLGNYVLTAKQKQEPYQGLQKAGANLRGLIRVLLFKRFESSVYAFQQTIDRMILAHERFLVGLDAGLIPAGKEAQDILNDQEAAGEELDIIAALRPISDKYDIQDFNAAKLQQHISHDLHILRQIQVLVSPITPAQDAKLQTLKQWLDKPTIKGKKQIIFTQYADTAQYLYDQLTIDTDRQDIEVIHSNNGKDKGHLVQRFAPRANDHYQLKSEETELNTLIATDILAEGLNLQDGDMIINYDLHWNPVKLIQRFGRIDRIGTEKETIYGYNFLPELGIEKNLGLKQKLQSRIKEIHETIGEDSAILDSSEELNESMMYAIYEKPKDKQLDLFALEPAPLIDLTDAEELLRQLRQHNPDEFDRIVSLPNGIRTARMSQEQGTFVFCESNNINDPNLKSYQQLLLLNQEGTVVSRDISKILSIIAAQEDTPSLLLPQTYNKTVTQTLRGFSKEAKQRQSEQHSHKLDTSQKYILCELEKLFKDDTEAYLKTAIYELTRIVKDIHSSTILKEFKTIKNNGIVGQLLLDKLTDLYWQYDLKTQVNSLPEAKKDLLISKIICGSALQRLGEP
jgi:superfamily II DNA or RNA helicase